MEQKKEHLVFISYSTKDTPVAQLICHRLEEAGIRCWIAPRDINEVSWPEAIMDTLARADIFLIIVGEHSIKSPQCRNELNEATNTCSYIIPFKLDSAELSKFMRYHLGPFHWLDASTPPLEARVSELIQRIRNIDSDEAPRNSRRYVLKERMVWPRPVFFGRDSELAEIAGRLPEEKVLFLQGMGGMGKSEIAKSYAKEHRGSYDTVVFLGYEGSILDLITSDAVMIENLPPQDAESESQEQYFRRKMDVLRKITSERTLFILDNYDVDEDPYFEELANLPCHLLVTTRNDHWEHSTLKIGPIADFDEVRRLFASAYGKPIKPEDQPVVDEMIRLVGCHTITVELIARQMRVSFRRPKEMLELLKKSGVNTRLREDVRRDGAAGSGSAFDNISRLFELSGLSPECEKLLLYMTMVPYTGIDIRLFGDICGLDSFDAVNELKAHSWLFFDEDTDILSMHPVVADVVREKLHPTVESCREYIAGLWREVGTLWFCDKEERTRLWPYYACILNHYFDPIPELWEEFSYLETNAWICGHYRLSIETGHRFLEYTKKTFPDDLRKIGIAATSLGGCYHNSGDDFSAAPYYEEGLECQKKAIREDSPAEDWFQLANAYQKVGRCAYLSGQFEKSGKCFEESIRICLEKDRKRGYMGNALLETGEMYQAMGDYEKGMEYAEKSLAFYTEMTGGDNANSGCSLRDIGKCRMFLGDYDGAKEALERAVELDTRFNGTGNRQTFRSKEALGDLAAAQGRRDEALAIYEEIEVEMARCFGEKNPDLLAIRKKISDITEA